MDLRCRAIKELTGVVMLPEGWTSGTRVPMRETIKVVDLCQDCSQDPTKAIEKCYRQMRD
jgi:hypothetical protein